MLPSACSHDNGTRIIQGASRYPPPHCKDVALHLPRHSAVRCANEEHGRCGVVSMQTKSFVVSAGTHRFLQLRHHYTLRFGGTRSSADFTPFWRRGTGQHCGVLLVQRTVLAPWRNSLTQSVLSHCTRRSHRLLSSPGDLLRVLAPHGEFSSFSTGDWRALSCVSPSLSKFAAVCGSN